MAECPGKFLRAPLCLAATRFCHARKAVRTPCICQGSPWETCGLAHWHLGPGQSRASTFPMCLFSPTGQWKTELGAKGVRRAGCACSRTCRTPRPAACLNDAPACRQGRTSRRKRQECRVNRPSIAKPLAERHRGQSPYSPAAIAFAKPVRARERRLASSIRPDVCNAAARSPDSACRATMSARTHPRIQTFSTSCADCSAVP